MTGAAETPAGARRRVRLAVRRAREARGLTQGQVADAMDWSLSKVIRIESGEVTVAPNDLRPLLGYLGVADQEELVAATRLAKRRRHWWDQPDVRAGLTPAMKQIVQLEPEATAVRAFYPMLIPGQLQTPEYAEAVLHAFQGAIPQPAIAARLAIRQHRREDLLTNANPPKTYTLIDESALHRRVGGAGVLGGQLRDLLDLSERHRLCLRVIPFAAGAPVAMLPTYEILYLSADEDEADAVMYRESDLRDEIVEDQNEIRRHRTTFEQLWNDSLDEAGSAAFIRRRLTEVES